MGLNITSNETYQDGTTGSDGYVHICNHEKNKDIDTLFLKIRVYKTKALRTSDKHNSTSFKGESTSIDVPCTEAEWSPATPKNGLTIAYEKLKVELELTKTVTDDN